MAQAGEWFEDETLWEKMAPMMQSEKLWAAAPGEVDDVLALLGVDPPASVLDLCCGPGRHSLELARRGFQVTGVELTAAYLDEAQRRMEQNGLEIEFIREDMRRFCRDNSFDGAINLFTSFGFFKDQADDRQVLINICRSLKKGGRLVLETAGKEIIAHKFRRRDWHERPDGVLFLEERTVTDDWSMMENRWILIDQDQRYEFPYTLRLYSAVEISTLLRECGFREVTIYGDLAGAPYDHEAQRLVAVAEN